MKWCDKNINKVHLRENFEIMWMLNIKKSSCFNKWSLTRIIKKRQQDEEEQTNIQPKPSADQVDCYMLLTTFEEVLPFLKKTVHTRLALQWWRVVWWRASLYTKISCRKEEGKISIHINLFCQTNNLVGSNQTLTASGKIAHPN